MSETARRLRIYGRVQGVFFRAWAIETARELGLTGWVRNRRDGSVEALAIGPRDDVEKFVRRCGEGPPGAEVDRVEVEEAQGEALAGFEKRPTA